MNKIERIKENILDWRDIQLTKLAEWFIEIVNIRTEDKNNRTELGRALNGFKKFKEADVAPSNIIIEDKLMNESYITQPYDSLTKEQRDEWKMHNVVKTKNKL